MPSTLIRAFLLLVALPVWGQAEHPVLPLAVDAVAVIGEHGDYPRTPRGNFMYPRWRYFDEITHVMKAAESTGVSRKNQFRVMLSLSGRRCFA